jgi:hypothetical protein
MALPRYQLHPTLHSILNLNTKHGRDKQKCATTTKRIHTHAQKIKIFEASGVTDRLFQYIIIVGGQVF